MLLSIIGAEKAQEWRLVLRKMNILFFLRPKNEVAYIYDSFSMRQAIEKMEFHGYTAIPIVGKEDGQYKGTLTEGDLLWGVKQYMNLNLQTAADLPVMELKRHRDNQPVHIGESMENLFDKVVNQNFVPVIDDKEHFIGIITRKDVIQYLIEKQNNNVKQEESE